MIIAVAGGRLPVIAGMGGIGKTAMAVRLAHQARGDFPDGQLYVDLRGAGAKADRAEISSFKKQAGHIKCRPFSKQGGLP